MEFPTIAKSAVDILLNAIAIRWTTPLKMHGRDFDVLSVLDTTEPKEYSHKLKTLFYVIKCNLVYT